MFFCSSGSCRDPEWNDVFFNKSVFAILVKNDKLVLKQLWDQREFTFEQKSALYFYNDERSFPLTFSKDANGEITQVLAFERDTV